MREAAPFFVSLLTHVAALSFIATGFEPGPRPLPIDRGRVSIELAASIAAKDPPDDESEGDEVDKTPKAWEAISKLESTTTPGKRTLAVLNARRNVPLRVDATAPQTRQAAVAPKRAAEKPKLVKTSKIPKRQRTPTEVPTEAIAESSLASIASQARQGVETEQPPTKYPSNPIPSYPPEALAAGWQGRVVLRVLVSDTGTVTAVSVETSSGYPALDAAALAAMRVWRFEPASRAGRSVAHEGLHAIRFRIEDR